MAERAGATITEVDGSHVIMISQPEAVTEVIESAIAKVGLTWTRHVVRAGATDRAPGLLNVGYVEVGPVDGQPVVLLHGWPYDIHSYAEVAPALGAAGYRVVVPFLRGYGTTRFLSDDTMRNGQQAALAVDVIALMDALGIESAVIGGFDWGARTANVVAALWPERCKAHGVGERLPDRQPGGQQGTVAAAGELSWWYQFYFATERGRAGYDAVPARLRQAHLAHARRRSGTSTTPPSIAARASFDNPDHVDIVIHNYRWRLGLAGRRAAVRRSREAARHQPRHHGAHDHPRR